MSIILTVPCVQSTFRPVFLHSALLRQPSLSVILLNSNEETYAYEYDEDGLMQSKTTNGDQKITYSYSLFFVEDPESPLEH